jgi:hypothetical protein
LNAELARREFPCMMDTVVFFINKINYRLIISADLKLLTVQHKHCMSDLPFIGNI